MIRVTFILTAFLLFTILLFGQKLQDNSKHFQLDSTITFNFLTTIDTIDTIYEEKETYSYDNLGRIVKYVSYYWYTDRLGYDGKWAYSTMYLQKFDNRDSLIEKITFEGGDEEEKWLWYRKTKEEYSYSDGNPKCNSSSFSEWDSKRKTWILTEKNEKCLNKQNGILYEVWRNKESTEWVLLKKECNYDSSEKKETSSKSCTVGYLFPFSVKRIDFKSKDTYEANGKTTNVTWYCQMNDTFLYNPQGKIAMHFHYNIIMQPGEKDSFIYENDGLKQYIYTTRFDEKNQKWNDKSSITISEFDSSGNLTSKTFQFESGAFTKEIYHWDKGKNRIFEEHWTKDSSDWKLTYKYTRHYEYDTKGRILKDEYYSWANLTDSSLTYKREFKYDSNNNLTLSSDPQGDSFEAFYDDNGNVLYERRQHTYKKYFYSKR